MGILFTLKPVLGLVEMLTAGCGHKSARLTTSKGGAHRAGAHCAPSVLPLGTSLIKGHYSHLTNLFEETMKGFESLCMSDKGQWSAKSPIGNDWRLGMGNMV